MRLLSIGIALAFALLACFIHSSGFQWLSSVVMGSSQEHVVVIGGGLADIQAARTLADRGYKVTVLEAQPRIGGRIITEYEWGGVVELGATFIHGVVENPLTELVQRHGIQLLPVDYDSLAVFDHDGKEVDEVQVDEMKAVYDRMRQEFFRRRDLLNRDKDMLSVFSAIWQSLNLTLNEQQTRLVSWHFYWEIVQDQVAQLAQLSSIEYDASLAFEGHDVILATGWGALLERMAAGLRVHVGQRVRRIVHNRDESEGPAITIKTEDGRSYSADRIVCTLPLGVLQRDDVVEFDPPLPRSKRRAIHRLGCAPTLKVALQFEATFWPRVQFFGKIGSRSNLFGDGEHVEFTNLDYHFGNRVLVAEVEGTYANSLSSLPEANCTAAIVSHLRLMFGAAVTAPTRVRRTNYVRNEFLGCGFSFWPPLSSGDDNEAIKESINDRIYFAGEHTSADYYGNLHGALIAGTEAAEDLHAVAEQSRSPIRMIRAWLMRCFSTDSSSSGSGSGTARRRKKTRRKAWKPKWCPAPCQ
eukprot:NODE_959_length_1795_cov_27.395762_g845_i0.p1 GENE.NODE_959_length_1795_cov_27.395762_g845_i0~~NODE_959_length_1795_cov_27.395762_g845_i0.p1  ORF type:complete len:557 (+),score=114.97 NODE_959_length_1795_cov_27.395762_g845_i0:96-1673(+)